MKRIIFVPLVVLGVTALAGATARLTRPMPLAFAVDSPEALAAAVLEAVQHRDRETLERLAISRQEFGDHVWPALPAARPERNLSADFVWADLAGKSRAYLARTLGRGVPPGARLLAVDFEEGASRYGSLTIHRQSLVTLSDPDGPPIRIRLFGSVLEQNGRYKVFSYVTD